jgi:hypothetical protein
MSPLVPTLAIVPRVASLPSSVHCSLGPDPGGRSHRIDAEGFYRLLNGVVIDDTGLFSERLREWEDFYNFNRPRGGLGGQTHYERLRQKTAGLV